MLEESIKELEQEEEERKKEESTAASETPEVQPPLELCHQSGRLERRHLLPGSLWRFSCTHIGRHYLGTRVIPCGA